MIVNILVSFESIYLILNTLDRIYPLILSENVKDKFERIILWGAIISFVVHLALIFFNQIGWLQMANGKGLLTNPISAIYTPFSFILIYEIYLLVFYIPRSTTTYITKQYEIITLVIIRRLFKDLSNLEISSDWFTLKYDLQFTFDTITSIILFYLIFLFFKNDKLNRSKMPADDSQSLQRFIFFKKSLAFILVPVLAILGLVSFFTWFISQIQPSVGGLESFTDINNVFFDEFFTILIIVDVILLLVSFFHTDQFHKVIRNSGFVISTILIRMSFSVEGLMNNFLIIGAVLFGWLILMIYNKFEYLEKDQGIVKK